MICHTDGCPASEARDEFDRPVTVQHGSITQPVLGATGLHLLNRQIDGTLEQHLRSWTEAEARRAYEDLDGEIDRVRRYLEALRATQLQAFRSWQCR